LPWEFMTVNVFDFFSEKCEFLLKNRKDIEDLNEYLKTKTGLKNFFRSFDDLNKFQKFINAEKELAEKSRDLGDFQTPIQLTDRICKHLSDMNIDPYILIEPTCGIGNFIISALDHFPSLKHIYCIEIQEDHEWRFKLNLMQKSLEKNIKTEISFNRDNIFAHQYSRRLIQLLRKYPGRVLILGNPPWVTNTELSLLNSNNLPSKSNIKKHRGIEAITGKGNFDIAEGIIIQMIKAFSKYKGTLAMLCKTTVIKNLVKDMNKLSLNLSNLEAFQIETKKEFGINADAALFFANLGHDREEFCSYSSLDEPEQSYNTFGWVDNNFVSDIEAYKKYKFLDGESNLIWRQGVKHDATKIMVLKENKMGLLTNGLDEIIDIEDTLLYPFLKSSDLKGGIIKTSNKMIIITQTSLKDDTTKISKKFPKLWNYLLTHGERLDRRKSVIYEKRPRFSIFGIGDYAFSPYKVAISGFYKKPRFSLIFPINEKPVMLDDTCYYLSFNSLKEALIAWTLFSTPEIKNFLKSIVFLDSKRPYTKEKLMRIDLSKLVNSYSFKETKTFFDNNLKQFLDHEITSEDFMVFKKKLNEETDSLLRYVK